MAKKKEEFITESERELFKTSLELISDKHKIAPELIIGKCRKRELMKPRIDLTITLLNAGMIVCAIAFFTDKDHASIINHKKVYENEMWVKARENERMNYLKQA